MTVDWHVRAGIWFCTLFGVYFLARGLWDAAWLVALIGVASLIWAWVWSALAVAAASDATSERDWRPGTPGIHGYQVPPGDYEEGDPPKGGSAVQPARWSRYD